MASNGNTTTAQAQNSNNEPNDFAAKIAALQAAIDALNADVVDAAEFAKRIHKFSLGAPSDKPVSVQTIRNWRLHKAADGIANEPLYGVELAHIDPNSDQGKAIIAARGKGEYYYAKHAPIVEAAYHEAAASGKVRHEKELNAFELAWAERVPDIAALLPNDWKDRSIKDKRNILSDVLGLSKGDLAIRIRTRMAEMFNNTGIEQFTNPVSNGETVK